MAKIKSVFICNNCGTTSPKWIGKCHACGEWNTYVEEVVSKEVTEEEKRRPWQGNNISQTGPKPVALPEIKGGSIQRLVTPDQEFNRVLGGGIVPGSLILIGGDPSNCFILTETNTTKILNHAQQLGPQLIITDSIQTLSSPHIESMPGSISQVRECAGELQRFAKEMNVPVIIIGHITKEGSIAGPKLLEHIVDAVLQFEGDQHYTYRILRTLKNRFGSTDEMGIYEMQANGLREVSNPSELLLSQKDDDLSGSAIAATMEGMRSMLIEVQALVSRAVYGTPQRSATGFDLRRLSMLLAVLEKRGGFPYGQHDVFLNIAGGIKVDDPAIDLAIVSALISSLEDIAIPTNICFAGEVGLSGEIRAVNRVEQRIQEADRLGFKKIYISKYNTKGLDMDRYHIKIQTIGKLEELYRDVFEE